MLTEFNEPLVAGSQVVDLAHLRPFVFEVLSEKVGRSLRVNVRFTNHCFTEGFDAGRHRAADIIIREGTRNRVFSPVRYDLSFRLSELIRGLADRRARVHQTSARRNWMYAVVLESPDVPYRYQIFFMLRRSPPERRAIQDLDLVVESAYLADQGRPEPNVLGRVGFLLLAGQVYQGKKVTTRP